MHGFITICPLDMNEGCLSKDYHDMDREEDSCLFSQLRLDLEVLCKVNFDLRGMVLLKTLTSAMKPLRT